MDNNNVDSNFGVQRIEEEEFKTYFGALGKYRFNEAANKLYRKQKIIGNISIELALQHELQLKPIHRNRISNNSNSSSNNNTDNRSSELKKSKSSAGFSFLPIIKTL